MPIVGQLTRARQAVAAMVNEATANDQYVNAIWHVPTGPADRVTVFTHVTGDQIDATDYGVTTVSLDVVMFVPNGDDESAQAIADRLIVGTTSIRTILAADRTLQGTCIDSALQREAASSGLDNLAESAGWLYRWQLSATLTNNET